MTILTDLSGMDLFDKVEAELLNTFQVQLVDDVEESSVSKLMRQLELIATKKPAELTFYITSHGGSVDAGVALIRTIEKLKRTNCKVIGEVRGYAMSMGLTILQSCSVRRAGKADVLMVHGVTSTTTGDIKNQEADLNMTKEYLDWMAELYAQRNTAKDERWHKPTVWRKLFKDETPTYLFGDKALVRGLIDELID